MNTERSNPVIHLELHTGNLARALGFYARVCGWSPERIQDPHGSYFALDLGRKELGGGIVECSADRPVWLPYVEVSEISQATERARAGRLGVARTPGGPGRM